MVDDVDARWSTACSEVWWRDAGSEVVPDWRRSSPAVLGTSVADLVGPVIDLGPSLGGETKSLYELSEMRGAFQGNRRSVMQQNMIARDQMSVGWGSYLERSYTSGARYGSEPTIPRVENVRRLNANVI